MPEDSENMVEMLVEESSTAATAAAVGGILCCQSCELSWKYVETDECWFCSEPGSTKPLRDTTSKRAADTISSD